MPTYSTAEPIPYDERGDYPGRDWPWWKDVARVATLGAYHPGDRDISRENDKVLAANTALKIEQGKAAAEIEQMTKTMRELGASEETIQTMAREMFKESETMAKAAANKKNMALDAGRSKDAEALGADQTAAERASSRASASDSGLKQQYTDAEAATHTPKIVAKTKENSALDAQKKASMDAARADRAFEDDSLKWGAEDEAGVRVQTAQTVAELQKLAAEQKLIAARQAGRLSTIESNAFSDDERRRMMRNRALNEDGVTLGAGSMRVDGLGEKIVNPINYGVVQTGVDNNDNPRYTTVRGTPIMAPPMSLGPSTAGPAPVSPAPGGVINTLTQEQIDAAKARRFAPR
jgi:hypothetical protein